MKWFHAVGICGKATSGVALMFKKMGWFVTGSDTQFIPPISTLIEQNNIPFDLGYHYSHMTREFWMNKLNGEYEGQALTIPEYPDLALIIDLASDKNKE